MYQARVNNNNTVVEIRDTTPSGDVYWTRIRLSPTGIPGVLSPSVEAKRPVHDTGIVGTHTTHNYVAAIHELAYPKKKLQDFSYMPGHCSTVLAW